MDFNVIEKSKSAIRAAIPFFNIKEEGYCFWDMALDIEKSVFLGMGTLEAVVSIGIGDYSNAAYAARNFPLYLMSCMPHYMEEQEVGEVAKILTNKKTIATLLLPLAIDLPRNIIDLKYDPEFDSFEAKYGFGPTTPQHFALGYCLSRATRYIVDGMEKIGKIGHGLGNAIKSILPGSIMIGYEGLEWTMPDLLDTKILDMYADLISDFAGQAVEIIAIYGTKRSSIDSFSNNSTQYQPSPSIGD